VGIELRILGPLEVTGENGPVDLRAAKHRRLLAALALARGRACSPDALVDAVWGASPPASARKLLQVYISQLRKALQSREALVTSPSGYALRSDHVSLDADRFERLLDDAVEAMEHGNPSLAVSQFERALALWRGPAYSDVMYEDFARSEAERLEEMRLTALEARLEALSRLGRNDEVLAEALAMARDQPLRERLQGVAMLALYRAGRQTEALDRYDELRRRLDDELGLEPSAELRTLHVRILQQDPELESSVSPAEAMSVLPVPPNPLVGRERDLDALAALLARRDVRLLVLTGAGGSGKTRLAFAAARQAASSFANGAVIVELAPLRDPGLVVPTIASALAVTEVPGQAPLDGLAAAVSNRELLLVLDNVEHLRSATPAFVELLARAPRLVLLVTSRAVLHLTGEHVFPVSPLDDDAGVQLFEQRARALDPDFQVTAENEGVVREICTRVDGLPLAIELAAARIRSLTPRDLLERLERRLTVLTGGPHDLPARQQTLRETIDWSVGLLHDDERNALGRLSVARAGATVEAAEAICETRLDVLSLLIDHHLVRRTLTKSGSRLVLLETIHEYAAELLAADPAQADRARDRLADWCLALANEAEGHLSRNQQTAWLDLLEAEHDNLRATLDHFESTGAAERQLTLAVSLSRYWYVRGHLTEGRARLEHALDATADQAPGQRRRALTAAASFGLLQGDHAAAVRFADEALAAAREEDDPRFVANALSNLGAILLAAGDRRRAESTLEEAVTRARTAGDERIAALAINNLGDFALTVGDYERAEPLFQESLGLLRALGDTANVARSLFNNGAVDLMLGRVADAADRFGESLTLCRLTGDHEDTAWSLLGLAATNLANGEGERGTMLLGAARSVLTQMGAEFKPFERHLDEVTEERSRMLLGAAAHEAALRRGSSLTLDEALDLAAQELPGLYPR
jgi:predicted ATPase/DNA-binding SARP family transcriptional activator